MSDATHAYAARKACGCLVAATVDRPEWRRATAKETAGWIRSGLTVERVTLETVRAELRRCECEGAPEPLAVAGQPALELAT